MLADPSVDLERRSPCKILTLTPSPCCSAEPSYETVSPLLCPSLKNCSLSVNDCPFGFQQDSNGCLLCQCLSSKCNCLLAASRPGARCLSRLFPTEMSRSHRWTCVFAHADVEQGERRWMDLAARAHTPRISASFLHAAAVSAGRL